MKQYDAIVIGSGCAMIIVEELVAHGLKIALVDRGPLGGTCANLGCIPSKLLLYPADRVVEAQEGKKLGIELAVKVVDFKAIMDRMRANIKENREHMEEALEHSTDLDYYNGEGRFVSDYTLEVNGQAISGKVIFIAAGARPMVPPIKGLDSVKYLTSESALQLTERPKCLVIVGGGYIAVEYGHFFAAMGTKVTMIEMADRLVAPEEPEISTFLKKELDKRMIVHVGVQAQEIRGGPEGVTVVVKDGKTGRLKEFSAGSLMMAVGRRSNADTLALEKTGVAVDERGYVKVNEYLETSKPDILAVGDINGRQMFTHMANHQASIAVHNVLHKARSKVDFDTPPPHAIFTHPQVAGVGFTEAQARKSHKVLVGRARYDDVAYGLAMMESGGFAKSIIEKDTEKILGFHIAGPFAAMLIQEVIDAMAAGGSPGPIRSGIHIHPALPELISRTIDAAEE